MDVEILARVQFAVTIMFHYIYPPLSIGLGLIMVIVESLWLITKNKLYQRAAMYWTKIFALTFALGVATGIVMEFEFGTNWASYSRFVGDVFGSALAAEGIFAFFLESGFLALLLFGWNRLSPPWHFFSTCMVYFGSVFSAVWITVANSWMQTPAGFEIVQHNGFPRAQITDFWAMVFSPSSVQRLIHVLLGAHLAAIFLVVSISAYYLLRKRFSDFASRSMKIGLVLAPIFLIAQGFSGDRSGQIAAQYQPLKLAAMEGLFKTQEGAPWLLFGIPDPETQTVSYQVPIPKLLSYLSFGNFNAKVTGMDAFPKQDWPKTAVLFFTFRLMVLMWFLMVCAAIWGLFLWWRGRLGESKPFLWFAIISVFFPQIANQVGWVCTEMGRYPWIVYNLMRISDGLSKRVSGGQVLSSLLMFSVVYLFLLIVFIYLLDKKIKSGPSEEEHVLPYHLVEKVMQRINSQREK